MAGPAKRVEPRRRHGPGRRAAATLLVGLGLGLAACGGGSDRAARVPVTDAAVPGVPATTIPAATAPAGARLAIATSQGMEVWSVSTGVFTVGPPVRAVASTDVAWSADGAYLSWQTVPVGPGPHGDELWYSDLRTGVTDHWGPLPPGRTYGPVVVTDTGVLTLGRVIMRYSPAVGPAGVGVTVAQPAGPVPPAARIASWLHGWVVEPSGHLAGQRVRRLSSTGVTIPPEIVLGDIAVGDGRLDLEAVGANGREVAAELGHHRTGCELSGTAQLWVASLTAGTVRSSTPPTSTRHDSQRFWAIDVSGPPGSIFASTFDCATKGKTRGRATSTVLWNFRSGTWHRVGVDLVAADQSDQGPLATLAGQIKVTHGVAAVAGGGTVSVDGLLVATGGQAVAWSPDTGAGPT